LPSPKLFLIGPMGSGKSTLARHLARRLGWQALDLDREIEARAGCSIPELFEAEGEAGFRDREQATLEAVARDPRPLVVATGGGAVVREANRELLRQMGRTVYLRASVEALLERVGRGSGRPLLQEGDPRARLQDLMAEREPYYREADRILETADRDPEDLAGELAQWLGSLHSVSSEGEQ